MRISASSWLVLLSSAIVLRMSGSATFVTTSTLFSDDAVALIHEASRGLPRAVNNLATQSLIAAYAANKSICDQSSARAAVAEITSE